MSKIRRLLTRKRGKTGFTLIELLVTITIIGIISLTTFAIIISAMNTFSAQKDVASATEIKDIVAEHLRDMIKTKSAIILTNDRKGPNNEVAYTQNITGDRRFIIDEKIKKHNLVYSQDGRVYFIEANARGKYQVDADANPMDMTENYPGKEALFDDKLYNGFDVEIRFKPMFTEKEQKDSNLRIEIDVINPKNAEVVVASTETFSVINIADKKGKAIESRTDTLVADETNALHKAYAFCYFA